MVRCRGTQIDCELLKNPCSSVVLIESFRLSRVSTLQEFSFAFRFVSIRRPALSFDQRAERSVPGRGDFHLAGFCDPFACSTGPCPASARVCSANESDSYSLGNQSNRGCDFRG